MTHGKGKVMFASMLGRSAFDRAENIKTLYDAYQGEKTAMLYRDPAFPNEIMNGEYSLMVVDSFPTFHPVKTIMIWHAIQGGKFSGLHQPADRTYKPEHAAYMDWVISSGSGGIDILSDYTGVPEERILNLGLPRTDRYIGKKKGDGGTFLAGKRAYFYAPTCRCRFEPQLPPVDWGYIDDQLTDDEILIVKPHPYGKPFRLGLHRHIKEAPAMEPSVNYLYDCDVVITDYSSIMFDAYLLNKPVVLFDKDHGSYNIVRGMYLSYPEDYCSRYATNERDLVRLLREADGLTATERVVINEMADACDGHSCERICELIERER